MPIYLKRILQIVLALFILCNIVIAFLAYKLTHFYDPGERCWVGPKFMKQVNEPLPDTAYTTIHLTTKSGLSLEGWDIQRANSRGTVALFHGHGGNKGDVLGEAKEFRKLGYNTLLMDFRAHGRSQGNTCTVGYAETEDVALVYDYLKKRGDSNIILWGISMGAAAIINTVGQHKAAPQKVILELPFGTILKAAEARVKLMALPAEPIATLITFWGGVEHGYWGFSNKPEEFAKQVKCAVLLQAAQNDNRVTKGEIKDIYASLAGKKELVVYEFSSHESLYKKEPEKWDSVVGGFLSQ
jgi:uncharacterized protein